jgi:hypothetical protein
VMALPPFLLFMVEIYKLQYKQSSFRHIFLITILHLQCI